MVNKQKCRLQVHKLGVLIWKNYKLQFRRPVQTFFEILFPIAMCFILVYIRRLVDIEPSEGFMYPSLNIEFSSLVFTEICYAPNNPEIEKLMEAFTKKSDTIKILGHQTSDDMVNYLLRSSEKYKAGLSFGNNLAGNKSLPKTIQIHFRTEAEQTDKLFADWAGTGPRNITDGMDYAKGFTTLQYIISRAIIDYAINKSGSNDTIIPSVFLKRFPHGKFVIDPYMNKVKDALAFIVLLGYIFPAFSLTAIISEEKEKKLKILMEIMGSSKTLYWLSWFIKSLTFFAIITIVMLLICKVDIWYKENPAVFAKSDVFVMFIFLLLYICATITFCFLITTIFSTAIMSSTVLIILFLFTFQPYMIIQHLAGRIHPVTRFLLLLLSNSAFGFGFEVIASYEALGVGLQWKNIWYRSTPENNLIMLEIMAMLILDAILYMLIALYIEAVLPGHYGVPKKWNFLFKKKKIAPINENVRHTESDPENHQEGLGNSFLGIDVRDVKKVFRKKYVALNNYSMKVYYGEVTLLLGPNGSGKTTILSIISGILEATSGDLIINGLDIKLYAEFARSSFGLCLQNSIVWDELTIFEHIYFFSRLKGFSKIDAKNEVEDYLYMLNMKTIEKKRVKKLSTAIKRSLAVAMAFTGDPDLVLLDEPTTELPTDVRRSIWEFVKSEKKDRIVLISSHSMVEADVLADRIAIIAEGTVKSIGTINYLKEKYGFGYTLIIDKNSTCSTSQVSKLLYQHIANITVLSDVGNHLVYSLKKNEAKNFEKAFKDLEKNSDYLGIAGFSISFTTLEEVFIKTASTNSDEDRLPPKEMHKVEGCKLIANQIYALFMKRILYLMRQWPILVIPFLCLLLLMCNLSMLNIEITEYPPLRIQLASYSNPIVSLGTTDLTNKYYIILKDLLETGRKVELNNVGLDSVADDIVQKMTEDEVLVKFYYILGIMCEDGFISGFFNGEPYHVPPLVLNLIFNAILQSVDSEMEIVVYNHPLPKKLARDINTVPGTLIAFTIGECIIFVVAVYILFYIHERACKIKHLQLIANLNVGLYWLVGFIWDWCSFITYSLIFLVIMVIFKIETFKEVEDVGRLLVLFMCFGFCIFPLIYLLSLICIKQYLGFIIIITSGICCLGLFLAVSIADIADDQNFSDITDIFMFLPFYTLLDAITKQSFEHIRFELCDEEVDFCLEAGTASDCWTTVYEMNSKCKKSSVNYFAWEKPGVLLDVIVFLLIGLIAFLILFLIEYKIHAYIWKCGKPLNPTFFADDDNDIIQETRRVNLMNEEDLKRHTLVVRNLTKYFGSRVIVNGVCFTVDSHECFGIVGKIGSSKTTILELITGNSTLSSGDIFVEGYNNKHHRRRINQLVGYCPQFNGLLNELTARETLRIFCLLRGFTLDNSKYLIEKFSKDFDFVDDLDKYIEHLCAGSRRKLSTSIALIGNPHIVYMDEPTYAMDPVTRHKIWNQIYRERESGRCFIVTSPSIDECNAVCTRLAFVVNGRFKCIGDAQYISKRYFPGFTLMVKLDQTSNIEEMEEIYKAIMKTFTNALILERYQTSLTYNVKDKTASWSNIFGNMERLKNTYKKIEDYSVGPATIEQVYARVTAK